MGPCETKEWKAGKQEESGGLAVPPASISETWDTFKNVGI